MKSILRSRIVLLGLSMILLACAANTVQAQEAGSVDLQTCRADEPGGMTEDYRWRWRAYHDLDCLISKLGQAINDPANIGKNQVTLPREDVEELLKLAWGARDASQRIGR
jgi:hypothetical protein